MRITPRPQLGRAIKLLGLTMADAGELVGVSAKTIFAWQRGAGGRTGRSIERMRDLSGKLHAIAITKRINASCRGAQLFPDVFGRAGASLVAIDEEQDND